MWIFRNVLALDEQTSMLVPTLSAVFIRLFNTGSEARGGGRRVSTHLG